MSEFIHPFSILNPNNALLGRVAVRDEVLFDLDISFVGITHVLLDRTVQGQHTIDIGNIENTDNLMIFLSKNPSFLNSFFMWLILNLSLVFLINIIKSL